MDKEVKLEVVNVNEQLRELVAAYMALDQQIKEQTLEYQSLSKKITGMQHTRTGMISKIKQLVSDEQPNVSVLSGGFCNIYNVW